MNSKGKIYIDKSNINYFKIVKCDLCRHHHMQYTCDDCGIKLCEAGINEHHTRGLIGNEKIHNNYTHINGTKIKLDMLKL